MGKWYWFCMVSVFCLGCVTIAYVSMVVPYIPLRVVAQLALGFVWGYYLAGLTTKDEVEQIRRRENGD